MQSERRKLHVLFIFPTLMTVLRRRMYGGTVLVYLEASTSYYKCLLLEILGCSTSLTYHLDSSVPLLPGFRGQPTNQHTSIAFGEKS